MHAVILSSFNISPKNVCRDLKTWLQFWDSKLINFYSGWYESR